MIKALLGFISPYFDTAKGIVAAVAVVAVLLGAFWLHHKVYKSGYDDAMADVKRGAEAILAKQTKAVAAADKTEQSAQSQNAAKAEIITKEVIHYVSSPDHSVCRLDAGFNGLHNASASNEIASPASQLDAATPKS